MGLHSINKGTKSFSGGGLPFYLEEDYVFSKINAGYIGGGEWRVPNEKLPTFQIWSIRDNVIAFQYKGIRADGTYTGDAFSPPIGLITKTAVKKDGVQYYVFSTSDDDILTTIAAGGRWIIELTIETTIGGATTTYFSEQFVTTECDTTCYSMDLDGVMEYIDCTNNVTLDMDRTDSFTISAWLKLESYGTANNNPIATKWDVAINRGYQFRMNGLGKIEFLFYNCFPCTSTNIFIQTISSVPLNQWVNVTLSYNGNSTASGCTIYLNGISQTFSIIGNSLSTTTLNNANFYIGYILTNYTNGLFFNVKMWDIELTALEVVDEYNAKSNFSNVQSSNLILSTDINNATWNGSEYEVPDLTGITGGYQTVNAEIEDLVEDCPS